jgi:Spy/CpxP family protein refolding chaperone
MTFECRLHKKITAHCMRFVGLSLLLGFCAFTTGAVLAQDDGTRVPPPPRIKHNRPIAQDEQFESPLKKGLEGPDMDELRAARQRLRNRIGGGQNGAFNGGANSGRFNGGDAPLFRNRGFGMQNGPGGMRPGQSLGFADREGEFGAGQRLGAGFNGAGVAGRRANLGGGGAGAGMTGLPGARKPLDLRPLNLSEPQKQRIRDIRAQTRADARELRQQLQGSQRQLRSLLFSPDATDAQIRQARRELRDAQDKLDNLNLNDWLQMRRVLSAEQKQRLPMVAPAANNPPAAQVGNAQPGANQ